MEAAPTATLPQLAAEQALLLRRPLRAQGGAATLPDRSERFQDIMSAARSLAQVGDVTAEGYAATKGGLVQLLSSLRVAPAAAGAAAPVRRACAHARAAHIALLAGAAVAQPAAAATAPTTERGAGFT